MSPVRDRARPGFTLVELMIVITVILILASMFLVIRPANPEGLANGQRMVASMIRSAKSQALMNRAALPRPAGFTGNWNPSDFRYRVLIKNDVADPDRHLREMVIAIGVLGVGASPTKYVWFSPDPPVLLPPGIFFAFNLGSVPTGFSAVNVSSGANLSGTVLNERVSGITRLTDTWRLVSGTYEFPGDATRPPMMRYRPLASPFLGSVTALAYFDSGVSPNFTHAAASGGREWFYVELGPDGSLNHTGRVKLTVGEGIYTFNGVRFEKPEAFAGILVRRNGEVALTAEAVDFAETSLK